MIPSQILMDRAWPLPVYELEALEQRYFLSAGFLDPSFGRDGVVVDHRIGGADQVLLQPDGKILVGGLEKKHQWFLARYQADGSPDMTFAGDGLFESESQFDFMQMVLAPDGKVVVATAHNIARINADGTPDIDFGNHGLVTPQL